MDISSRIALGALGVVGVPLALFAVLGAAERLLRTRSRRTQNVLRPWLWLSPALILLLAIMVYPLVDTIRLSLFDAASETFTGIDNYVWAVTDEDMVAVLRNNLLWLVLMPTLTLVLGAAAAIATDRVRYERVAKSLIILPTAISFVVAGATWQLVYSYDPPGSAQTGLLNAVVTSVAGVDPKAWLLDSPTNNYALIFVGVWMGLGLATIVLSAAVKGVPRDLVDAARIDGASEWRVIRHVIVVAIRPALVVVGTTMLIFASKVFDVVYVLTNGNYETDVIGTRFYAELTTNQNYGRASAIAVLLFLVAVPIAALNWRRMRRDGVG
jgi:alpha-glucoside transport system permease protein